jgi:hypothetical protein
LVIRYYIFKFSRAANTAFPAGINAAHQVKFESFVDLATNTTPIATVSPIGSPGSIALTASHTSGHVAGGGSTTGWDAGAAIMDTMLDHRGHFIISYNISIAGLVKPVDYAFPPVTNLAPAGFIDAGYSQIFSASFMYPVVCDLTSGEKILDGFSSGPGALLNPLPPSTITFNSFDFNAGLPGTWFTVATVGGGLAANSYSLWGFTPSIPNVQHYVLEVLFVAWKTGDPLTRVKGWVGHVDQETGQMYVWEHYFAADAPDPRPANPPPTTGVGQGVGTMVCSPTNELHTVLTPFTFGRPLTPTIGLRFGATYSHLIWQPIGSELFFGNNVSNLDEATPCNITVMDTGVTVVEPSALSAKFHNAATGNGPMTMLVTDFIYWLDMTASEYPAGTKTNYFAQVWHFRKAVSLTPAQIVAPIVMPEDTAMSPMKPLAAVPTGVTQPKQLGLYDLQVVNDAQVLSTVGEFLSTTT